MLLSAPMRAESSTTATKTAAAAQIQIAFRAHRLDRLAAAVSARFALQGTQRDDAATREALDRDGHVARSAASAASRGEYG